MVQSKFSVKEPQAEFLSRYKEFGYKDKSMMLRAAIDHFKQKLESDQLKKSADLYAELYGQDEELEQLTESAMDGWPE
jgi:hypothetical protein